MDVCRQVVPPEVGFSDGVRVACHLHPPGQNGGVLISAEDVAARRGIAVPRPVSPVVAAPGAPT